MSAFMTVYMAVYKDQKTGKETAQLDCSGYSEATAKLRVAQAFGDIKIKDMGKRWDIMASHGWRIACFTETKLTLTADERDFIECAMDNLVSYANHPDKYINLKATIIAKLREGGV